MPLCSHKTVCYIKKGGKMTDHTKIINQKRKSIFNGENISLLFIFLYSIIYYFIRGYMSNIKDNLMTEMQLTAVLFSKISAALPIGYSLSQISGGHLLDKLKMHYIMPFSLGLAALANYIFASSSNQMVVQYSRYMLGMVFCLGATGRLHYLTKVWPKHFLAINSVIGISMSFAGAFFTSATMKPFFAPLRWRHSLKALSIFMLFVSIGLFFSLKRVEKNHEQQSTEKVEEKISFITSLKAIVNTPNFIYQAIFIIMISGGTYILMDGYGNNLMQTKFLGISSWMINMPATMNMLGNGVGALCYIFAGKWRLKTQMLISSTIAVVSTVIIAFFNPSPYVALLCFFGIGMSYVGQYIAFLWGQREVEHKYQGLTFGIMNFLGVFFGGAMMQRLAGYVLDYARGSSFTGYSYDNILTIFKLLLIPHIVALLIAFLIKNKEKRDIEI